MYAIIATGGKQYKVSEGETIKVEKPVSYTHLDVYKRQALVEKMLDLTIWKL